MWTSPCNCLGYLARYPAGTLCLCGHDWYDHDRMDARHPSVEADQLVARVLEGSSEAKALKLSYEELHKTSNPGQATRARHLKVSGEHDDLRRQLLALAEFAIKRRSAWRGSCSQFAPHYLEPISATD